MPEVWHEVLFRGEKKETKLPSLFNSGSYFVVLPATVAKLIRPRLVGTAEIELADGRRIKRKAYEIDIEVVNEEANETRKAKTHATIEKRDYPLVGTEAMEKLRINLDIVRGKVSFV